VRARPRRFHFGVPQASTSRTAALKRSVRGEPKNTTEPKDIENDYFGRNPPSDQRIFREDLQPGIEGKRVAVFWWLHDEDGEGKVIGHSGRWYSAEVRSYDFETGTLNVRYYEDGLLDFGGPLALSRRIDAIDITEEHVYLDPDDESDKVRRPSITRARAHAHTHAHTHGHTPAFPHSPSESQHRAHAHRGARVPSNTPRHTPSRAHRQIDKTGGHAHALTPPTTERGARRLTHAPHNPTPLIAVNRPPPSPGRWLDRG